MIADRELWLKGEVRKARLVCTGQVVAQSKRVCK